MRLLMLKIFRFGAVCFTVVGIQACTLEGGCEYYYNYSTGNDYMCTDVSTNDILPPKDSDVCFYGDGNSFHESTSCSSLGYSTPNSYSSDILYYNSNKDPSPYGSYGSGSFGGSGGSTGGNVCNEATVWAGDPADVQVSTICQGACVYANAGHQQGLSSSCSIVASWGATSSCSVCP